MARYPHRSGRQPRSRGLIATTQSSLSTASQEHPLFGSIVGLIIIGIVAGYVARAIVPGGKSVTLSEKIALGIAGSFLGGLLVRVLLHQPRGFVQVSSWVASIIGSVIVLFVHLQMQQRRA